VVAPDRPSYLVAVRSSGVLEPGGSYGSHDHASWGYRTPGERSRVVCAWLADGLRAGQRCLYVGAGPHDALHADLAAGGLGGEPIAVRTVHELYDLRSPIDPGRQLAIYDDAVTDALADGCTGVRVAADISRPPTRSPTCPA
jgi:hypothetical protein